MNDYFLMKIYLDLLKIVLNEINQHAHGDHEKPSHFKLADICLPVSNNN